MRKKGRYAQCANENLNYIVWNPNAEVPEDYTVPYKKLQRQVVHPAFYVPIKQFTAPGGTMTIKDIQFSYFAEQVISEKLWPELDTITDYFIGSTTVKLYLVPYQYKVNLQEFSEAFIENQNPLTYQISDKIYGSDVLQQAFTNPFNLADESFLIYSGVTDAYTRENIKVKGPFPVNEGSMLIAAVYLTPKSYKLLIEPKEYMTDVPEDVGEPGDENYYVPGYVITLKSLCSYKIKYN